MMVTAMQRGINIEYELRGHSLVYDARNGAAKYFLTSDADALLFLDSDMMPPPDMLTKLVEHDKPIVSALAFKRVPDYEPCIFREVSETEAVIYHDYPKGLIEVAGVGMACCLIKKEVFEKVPPPWFMPGELGEDLAFCKRVREAGIPVYCDTTLICKHVGTVAIEEGHYAVRRNAGQE
jgi:GT2 family glycosyltransferase